MRASVRSDIGTAGRWRGQGAQAATPAFLSAAARRMAKPDVVLWGLAGMVFIYIWRVQSILTPLALIRPGILAGVAAIALYLADRNPLRRAVLLKSPLLYVLLGLVVASALSIPTSLWFGRSAMFFASEIIPNTIFALLIASAMRSLDDIVWFSKVILAGALVYGMVVMAFYDVGSLGRLGHLIHYDSNDLALLLVCSIPFAVYFLGAERRLTRRLFALGCLGLFTLLLILTGSRGGFLGFIGVMSYIVLRYSAIPAKIRLFSVVGGALLLLFAASDTYWDQMRTMLNPDEDYNIQEVDGRKQVWTRGVGYMAENPIFGVGLRAFPVAEGQSEVGRAYASEGRGFKWSVAHNSFVETGAELGVPGLLLFIAVFVMAFRVLRRIRAAPGESQSRSRSRALAQMLIGSYIGFLICGFFLSAQHFSFLYALIGMTLALWKIDRLGAHDQAPAARPAEGMRVRPSVVAAMHGRRG